MNHVILLIVKASSHPAGVIRELPKVNLKSEYIAGFPLTSESTDRTDGRPEK